VRGQVLLRDLVAIPEEVHAGDYVLTLSNGIEQRFTVDDYVVTPQLAGDFDRALELVQAIPEHLGRSVKVGQSPCMIGSGQVGSLRASLGESKEPNGRFGRKAMSAGSEDAVRGGLPLSEMKQQFSLAYIRLVVAAVGFTMNPKNWLEWEADWLGVNADMYWSLAADLGDIADGAATKTIHIPTGNLFDVSQLRSIMESVGRDGGVM
jgi:hypothetical protein